MKQMSIPMKLRFKNENTYDFLILLSNGVQNICHNSHAFRSLTKHDRCVLLNRTLKHVVLLSSIFTLKSMHPYDDIEFSQLILNIYGTSSVFSAEITSQLFDSDMTIVKLIFPVIMFSTLDYIDAASSTTNILSNTSSIQVIQDQYLELMWQYLISQNGYQHAVRCFSKVVRCVLASIQSLSSSFECCGFQKAIDRLNEQAIENLGIF